MFGVDDWVRWPGPPSRTWPSPPITLSRAGSRPSVSAISPAASGSPKTPPPGRSRSLGAAGLVVLQRVPAPDGQWRSGYRLQLPDGVELRARPNHPDTALPNANDSCPDRQDSRCPTSKDSRDHCPNGQDTHSPTRDHSDGCPTRPDSPAPTQAVPARPPNRRRQVTDTSSQAAAQHRRPAAAIQPTLFNLAARHDQPALRSPTGEDTDPGRVADRPPRPR